MHSCQTLKVLALAICFLPSITLARGGIWDIGELVMDASFGPIDIGIISLSFTFALYTAWQAIQAILRISNHIPFHVKPGPERSLGYIFPMFFILSLFQLITVYILHGVYWSSQPETPDGASLPAFPDAYISAWNAMGFLQEIFFVSGLLGLISHRSKAFVDSQKLKMMADTILVLALLALGMVCVALIAADKHMASNIYVIYVSLFLIAVLGVAISSSILFKRTRRNLIDDGEIAHNISFIISPCFVIYAIFFIIQAVVNRNGFRDVDTLKQWDFAGLVIGGVAELTIIVHCLKFWVPATPEPKKEIQEVPEWNNC